MRVALLSHNACFGDALGNQVAARARFFLDRGDEVQTWIECDRRLHPSLRGHACRITDVGIDELLVELRRADCLIVHFGQDYRALDVLPKLAGTGPRVVFDYYGVTPPELWNGPAEQLRAGQDRRNLVWYADVATVHSRFMRDELCRATGYPEERVRVLPLWFRPAMADPNCSVEPRQRWGVPASARCVLFVGRVAPNKRLPILIEALSRLRSEEPPIHLLVLGDDREVYRQERERCERRAAELGLADRIHWRGHVSDDELASAYRDADLLVLPSVHEGCGLPVLEAMASELPVVVAHSSALPETMAGAGLSFTPDDPDDLACQIRRVLSQPRVPKRTEGPRRIAVVSPRFGPDVVGGAEQSLRQIVRTWAERGHRLEVFTTLGRDERLPGVTVHRFPGVSPEPAALASLHHRMELGEAVWHEFVHLTRTSDELLEAWAARHDEFDLVIVGPYSCGLTWQVIRRCPERGLLLPCFHDEPLARQPELREACRPLGGLLFHSEAERRLAQQTLGIHHPNWVEIGTYLPPPQGQAERGRRRARTSSAYLLYSGRACKEKNFDLLLEWFGRYRRERGQPLELLLTGATRPGTIAEGVRSLGRLSESALADVLAGAACLVQLSTRESLSLVSLAAWNHGVPVLAHRRCDVLREFIEETGGGQVVADYTEFRAALDDLLLRPGEWTSRGQRGQQAVRDRYGSTELFAHRLEEVWRGMHLPLADLMRHKGRQVVAQRCGEEWSQGLLRVIRQVMELPPRSAPSHRISWQIVVSPPRLGLTESLNVRVINQGEAPLWPATCRIIAESGEYAGFADLDRVVAPGQSAWVRIPWPRCQSASPDISVRAEVEGRPVESVRHDVLPRSDDLLPRSLLLMEDINQRLERAASLSQLPTGYVDVSEGWFAGLKRWIKRKILGQFQTAYVDVLARQQSAFNRAVVDSIRDLSEQVATLADQLNRYDAPDSRRTAAWAEFGPRVEHATPESGKIEPRRQVLSEGGSADEVVLDSSAS